MWRGVHGKASLSAFPNFKNKSIVNHILYRVVSTEEEPEPRFVAVGRITGKNNEFKPSTSMLMKLFQILLRLRAIRRLLIIASTTLTPRRRRRVIL